MTDSDGIALVTWDMPDRSMNVFTEEVMRGARQRSSTRSPPTPAIKGAVITSGKESFSGGADLTMLRRMLGVFERRRPGTRTRRRRCLFDTSAA